MIKLMDINIRKEIVELYKAGLSSYAIKERIELPITVRQVQRIVKRANASRNQSEARHVAIKSKRMDYSKKKESIRYCPHCNHKLW